MDLNQIELNDFVFNLKKIKYKNILQEFTLEYNNDECTYIHLTCIKIKKSQRSKGYGSAVMFDLIKLSDFYNVQIRLYATNIFGAELKRLYTFYRKHGLVLIKNNNDGLFIYRPSKKIIKNTK